MRESSVHVFLQCVAWLIALAWLAKFVEAARGLRSVADLTRAAFDQQPKGEPWVTVIVPARNEARDIVTCLTSLLAQDYARLRVIAVDDRSTDSTGELMEALAVDRADRLTVIRIKELPAGWLGKTHAMAVAARTVVAADGPGWLLLTDGDIFFAPEIVRRSLAYAVAERADHFVCLPTTLAKSVGEAMILSFMQVMGLWGVRPWRVADPKAMRDAIGIGAFNLMRTTAYVELGGFDAMKMEILEDMALGRRVKLAGMRQRVASAPGQVTVHWAAGVFGIVNNMTKNLFAVFRFRVEFIVGAAVWLVLFLLAPVVLVATPGTRVAGWTAVAGIAGMYWLSSRTSRIPAWYAALFPVSALLILYSMMRSMVVTLVRGGVVWRGTFYPLRELRRYQVGDGQERE